MSASLDRAVEVMDRLRSPGGCPWDAEQTHRSLARYLLEETYEVLEAIETDDPVLLREELGDLLLQVLFHARLAQERSDGAFGIDEVAGDLADKLVRRHPHVFGDDAGVVDADALDDAWERNKIVEKGRTSAADGVPLAQPALALTAKLVSRARRAGLSDGSPPVAEASAAATSGAAASAAEASGAEASGAAASGAEAEIGRRLFEVVSDAVTAGVDPEGALRRIGLAYRDAIRSREDAVAEPAVTERAVTARAVTARAVTEPAGPRPEPAAGPGKDEPGR